MMRARKTHIFEKEQRGHYVEPAWVSERLFEVEQFSPVVYDPSCGWGTITWCAQGAGYDVWGSDIVDRGRHGLGGHFRKRDFLTLAPVPWKIKPFSIVCNPPFDFVQEFCEHALEVGAEKVAMICLVRRLNAAHWLRALPLERVWLLTPRPSMPPGSWIAKGGKPGGGTQDFCWLVFNRGRRLIPDPELKWLHRDERPVEIRRGVVQRALVGTAG
jgi:hypothetical protein